MFGDPKNLHPPLSSTTAQGSRTTRSSKAMLTQSVLTPHGNVSVQTDRLTVHEETSMNVVVREDNEVHPSSSSSSSSLLSLQTTHPDPTPKEKDKKKKKKNESSQRTSRVRTRLKVACVNTHARSRSRQHGQPTPTPSGSEVHPPTAAPSHTTHPPLHVSAATQPIVNPLHEDDQDQSPTVTLPVFAFTAPSGSMRAEWIFIRPL